MNRRTFLKALGFTTAAVAIGAKVDLTPKAPKPKWSKPDNPSKGDIAIVMENEVPHIAVYTGEQWKLVKAKEA